MVIALSTRHSALMANASRYEDLPNVCWFLPNSSFHCSNISLLSFYLQCVCNEDCNTDGGGDSLTPTDGTERVCVDGTCQEPTSVSTITVVV